MDVSALVESLQRGFAAVPPTAIALALLAGPTVALIGYRLVAVAQRMRSSPKVEATPLWVCDDCLSVNELRASHCYRCGLERDWSDEIEIVVDRPAIRRTPSDVPAGSPFAAVAARGTQGPGVPVMADRDSLVRPVAVGPGRTSNQPAVPPDSASVDAVEARR